MTSGISRRPPPLTTDDDHKPKSFKNLNDILGTPPPTDRPAVEIWHATAPGFGARIMKARKDGRVRRAYLSRIKVLQPDGREKEEKPVLGLVEDLGTGEKVLTYKQAEAHAYKLVSDARQRKSGGTVRMTVGDAYAKLLESLDSKLSNDSPKYGEKMVQVYERFLAHLASKHLDALKEGFWIDFLKALREGRLQVGMETDKTGAQVPAMRKAESANYALSVLNGASRLYRIAHEYRGIEGEPKGWDPTREAVAKIEAPNTRDRHLELKDIGKAWRATNSVMSPWWRDLWRVYLLTGLRDRLVMDMRFDRIDFERGLYLIDPLQPGTKRQRRALSQEERGKFLEMPLSHLVLDILRARKEFAPKGPQGEWVWYSLELSRRRKKTGSLPLLTDPRSSWQRLTDIVGYWTYKHDLRRTFASLAGTIEPTNILALSLLLLHSNDTIAKALNIPAITLDYIKKQQRNMRTLTEKVAAAVLELAGEAPRTELTRDIDGDYQPLPDFIDRALVVEERIRERQGGSTRWEGGGEALPAESPSRSPEPELALLDDY